MISVYQGITVSSLLPAAAYEATANGSALDIRDYKGVAAIILDAEAGGEDCTLDVKLQECDTSDGTYVDVSGASFTQIGNAASCQSIGLKIDSLKRYIRAVVTIAGSGASFAAACVFAGRK